MVQQKTLKLYYHFKIIRHNWIKILVSLVFFPTYCFVLLEILASTTSNKHNFHQRSKRDLYFCLKSTKGSRYVVSVQQSWSLLYHTHTNTSFCIYFTCWPQYTSISFLEIITQVVIATWRVRERQGDFCLAYFPIVICVSLTKNSTCTFWLSEQYQGGWQE